MTTKEIKKVYTKFLHGCSGKDLLSKHSLDEIGIWRVEGEDPNCDFGGSHNPPTLGYLKGSLHNVIYAAVQMPRFFNWGAGGQIYKIEIAEAPEAPIFDRLENTSHQAEGGHYFWRGDDGEDYGPFLTKEQADILGPLQNAHRKSDKQAE